VSRPAGSVVGAERERRLERLSPASRSGILLGNGVLAAVRSVVLIDSAVVFLDVSVADGVSLFVGVELLGTLSDRGVCILLSLFAETAFRAIRFIPVVSSPQAILGGTFQPVAGLPVYLA